MSVLLELNGFVKSPNGVWAPKGERLDFNYSDGQKVEQKLAEVLSNASDLSSESRELNQQIVDWPTEYHLSSVRANLLRGLDLSGVKRVLELGAGCGSITRYLAEQPDIEVDSVEGSDIRASLAAMRCRDLSNVTIITANFNEIVFPEDYYDLVLFVGVTEYAGRFSSAKSDQESLQELLTMAHTTCKGDGVTFIAIENRTGLKYALGANEDHYGIPYIGIENYPNSTGIRTYSKKEWRQQVDSSAYSYCSFLYPFPDYKIPTLLISDAVLQSSENLEPYFEKIQSRDYLADFHLEKESQLWKACHEAGVLGEVANSFLLLLSDQQQSIDKMLPNRVCEFDDPNIVKQYINTASQNDSAKVVVSQHEHNLMRSRAEHLENQLALLQGSRSWRLMHAVRSVLKIFGVKQRQ